MRRALIVLVSAVALVAAACGGDDSSTTEDTTTTSSSTTSTTATTQPPAPTTTTQPGPKTCQTSALAATFGPVDAGAGQRHVVLVLKNNGQVPCTMFGFPGLELIGANGQNVPSSDERDPSIPKTLVTLQPGNEAYTTISWSAIASGNEPDDGPCQPDPAQIAITSPNETTSLFQPWANGPVCNQGELNVQVMQFGSGPPNP